jgi:dihydropteroate synthase
MPHRLVKLLGDAPPWLMGVVNVTPDSFTDGGRFLDPATALAHARDLAADGAGILDIGGESTGPGSVPIDGATELARVEPVVRALAGGAATALLSVDTYHAATAARCVELGAAIVNDVSALRADPEMAAVVRDLRPVLVMMHAKDGPLPHATDRPVRYDDVVFDVGDWLAGRVDVALRAGIEEDQLVLDPGWGRFLSLEPAHSWEMLARFDELVARLAPIPVMVGISRKGFFGVPMAERDPLSQLTSLVAAEKGAAVIRTHDVRMARQFLDAADRMRLPLPARTARAGGRR